MRYLRIIAWLQLISCTTLAQSSPRDEGLIVNASIVQALKYPGVKVGAAYKLIDKEVQKSKPDGRLKVIHKNRYLTANVGFYYHKDYNANIFLQGGYQWQRQYCNGWFQTIEPQLGLSRTLIDGAVYNVKEDGSVTKKHAAGHFYLAPSLSVGIGKDLSIKHEDLPITIFTKLTLYTNLPYNNFIYGRIMAELGVSYQFTELMKHQVKSKYKKI